MMKIEAIIFDLDGTLIDTVRSAYEAGCNVIMVPDLSEPDEDLKKMLYACVRSLEEIRELIANK